MKESSIKVDIAYIMIGICMALLSCYIIFS